MLTARSSDLLGGLLESCARRDGVIASSSDSSESSLQVIRIGGQIRSSDSFLELKSLRCRPHGLNPFERPSEEAKSAGAWHTQATAIGQTPRTTATHKSNRPKPAIGTHLPE